MNPIQPKVWAATAGAGATGALCTIGIWVATDPQFGFNLVVPLEIAAAFQTLLMSAGAFASGWFKS